MPKEILRNCYGEPLELMRQLNVSNYCAAQDAVLHSTRTVAPQWRTASSLRRRGVWDLPSSAAPASSRVEQFFRNLLQEQDGNRLHDLLCGSVYEFVGEAATGKSRVCSSFALRWLTACPTSGVIWLDTDCKFNGTPLTHCADEAVLRRLRVFRPRTLTDVADFIKMVIERCNVDHPLLGHSGTPRLLVIDTIAAAVRAEQAAQQHTHLGGGHSRTSSGRLMELGAYLKRLVGESNWAAIVINQVTTVHTDGDATPPPPEAADYGAVLQQSVAAPEAYRHGEIMTHAFPSATHSSLLQPALGLGWSDTVMVRVLFMQTTTGAATERDTPEHHPQFTVVALKSPIVPPRTACIFRMLPERFELVGTRPWCLIPDPLNFCKNRIIVL